MLVSTQNIELFFIVVSAFVFVSVLKWSVGWIAASISSAFSAARSIAKLALAVSVIGLVATAAMSQTGSMPAIASRAFASFNVDSLCAMSPVSIPVVCTNMTFADTFLTMQKLTGAFTHASSSDRPHPKSDARKHKYNDNEYDEL